MSRTAYLILLLSLSVGLRLAFTYGYRGSLETVPVRTIAGADAVEYDDLARSVAAGRGYAWSFGGPTSFRAPGFPLFVAAIYALGGGYLAAYASFAVCGGLMAISAFLLGREVIDERGGRIAGLIAAAYPGDVFACSYYFSEVLFAPLLGFGAWSLVRALNRGSISYLILAGALFGSAALTRSFAVLLLPLPALVILAQWPGRRWRAVCAYSMAFLAPVLPWTIRNHEVHGRFVLIATNGGSTFYGANNPVVSATPRQWGNWLPTTILPGRDLIDAQPDEVSHDKMEYRLGYEWVFAHPLHFAKLAVFKIARFWMPFVQWPSLKTYPVVNIATTAPLLILIGYGLYRALARSNRRRFAVLHIIMLANLVMVVVFWGDPRFRDANAPVLAVYGAFGTRLFSGWRAGRQRQRAAPRSE